MAIMNKALDTELERRRHMTLKQLAQEIDRLKPRERERLLRILTVSTPEDEKRGGSGDPFSRLIGKFTGAQRGSLDFKEDLYGGDRPL